MTEPDSRSIDELIDAVPWGRLATAYGFALDAPARLRAQVGAAELDQDFEDWLFGSVVHQGTPSSGTAPTLWLLRRIVAAPPGHPALGPCLVAVAECAKAIAWIDSGGHDAPPPARYRSPEGDPLWASALPPGYETPPESDGTPHDDYFMAARVDVATLKACVADWHTTIARCLSERDQLADALEAGSAVVRVWPEGPVTDALVAVAADTTVAEPHRAGALYALSRMGHDMTGLAHRDDRALRFAIALGQPDRADHLEVLVDALGDLPWLETTFPHGLPGAEPWLLATVVPAVLDHTPVAGAGPALVDALEGLLARPSNPFGATYEWGPVLAWAFPDRVQEGVVRPVPLPETCSPLQRRLLAALVGNDNVWNPTSGNDSLALARVGLPHDRAAVASLAGVTPPTPSRRWRRRSRGAAPSDG